MSERTYKLFVSQPMSGLTMEQIKEDRNQAVEYFKNLGVTGMEIEVIDNLQEDHPDYYIAADYLANDIRMLGRADGIVFVQGWETHRGCLVEFEVARNFVQGIDIYFE